MEKTMLEASVTLSSAPTCDLNLHVQRFNSEFI